MLERIMKQNNMRKIAGLSILAVVSVCAYVFGSLVISNTPTAEAAIPKYINFQGKITAASDGSNVANGTYAFEFKLYDAVSSGTLLWTETWDQSPGACGKLTVTNGVFNAKLGDCASLAGVDFTGGSLFLSVNFAPTGVAYDGEMAPRKQLVASAFAFVANSVVGDGKIDISPTVSTSGSPNLVKIVGPAHTTLANAESADLLFNLARIVQFGQNTTLALQRAAVISAPTYSSSAATKTINDAATFAITGAPVEGTNADIDNSHALLIQGGAATGADSAYGLTVNAPTGATANYAAAFLGGNVGIGTAAPRGNLDIQNGASGATIYLGTDDALANINYIYGPLATGSGYGRPFLSLRSAVNGNTAVLQANGDSFLQFGANVVNSILAGYNPWIIQTTGPSTYIAFEAGGSERMRIDGTTGNVGIGDTGPDALLDIKSTAAADNGIIIEQTNAGDFDPTIQYQLADGTTNFTLGVDDSVAGDPFKISTTALGTGDLAVLDSRTTTSGVSAISLQGIAPTIASATGSEYTTLTVTSPTINLTGTTTVTSQMDSVLFGQPTIVGDTATLTINNAAAVTINGPAIESTNIDLDSAYALKINQGSSTTADAAYGLHVTAPTGATNNYSAAFMGGNVGVGTAAPSSALHVASGDITLQNSETIGNSVDGTIRLSTSTTLLQPSSAGNSALRLLSGGSGDTTLSLGSSGDRWQFLSNVSSRVLGVTFVESHDPADAADALVRILSENSESGGEKLRIADDASNYASLKVSNTGNLDFTTTGSVGHITFNPAATGNVGIATTAPDRPLEINSATGLGLRLTYNDSNGSATNYADLQVASGGELNILPSGFITNMGGGTTRIALRFLEPSGTGTDYAAIQSHANVTTSYTWSLPAADSSGCIQSDGAGQLSIAACGGGSQTPWTSDIDADGFDLKDLSNLEFRDTTGAPAGSVVAIFSDNTGDLNLNSLTAKTTNIQVNGTDEYNFSSTALAMNSNNITGLGTALTAAAGLTVTATAADLALVTATSGNITIAPASTGSVQITSGVTTGTTTSSAVSLVANSLTTGTGLNISSSSLSSGSLVNLAVTGTAGASSQKVLNISTTGVITGTQTTYGGYFSNTHSGGTSTNVGLYSTATGGTNNYAAIFEAGNVGIGTTTPGTLLEVDGLGGARFASFTGAINTGGNNGTYFTFNPGGFGSNGTLLFGYSEADAGNRTNLTVNVANSSSNIGFASLQMNNDNGVYRSLSLQPNGGNVGVGTTTPAQKLAVADGSILVNSTSTFTPSAMSGGFDAGAFNVNSVVVTGKYLYMGKAGSDTATCTSPGTLTGCELSIFDISNPNSMTNVAGINITDGVNAIAVSGKYLYFATNSNGAANELRIYDITNPGVPVSVTGVSYDKNLNSIYVQGKLLFLGFDADASTGTEVKIYDISNPASPVAMGSVDTAGASGTVGSVKSMYATGKYLYIGLTAITGTCTGTGGTATGCEFRVYDISDPINPSYKAGVDATVDVNSVAISGKYAYTGWATISGNDVRVYDISDSTVAPTSTGGIDLSTGVNNLQVYGRYVFAGLVSASGNDFRILDASDPATLTNAGGVDLSVDVKSFYVAGKYAYIGAAQASGNDVRIYDVAGTDTPTLAAGSAGIGQLQVTDNAYIANELTVGNSLNLGVGGIQSSGAISLDTSVLGGGATAVAGLFGNYAMTPSVGNAQYGNRFVATISDNNGNSSTTEVGTLLRMIDNSNDAQVVRALEVQAYSGSNVAGINTGIQTYGYTYGIYATTTAQANAVDVPAAVLANLDNGSATTSGNAIRAYTSTATSADLVYLQQSTSTMTGTALLMNMAASSGTFTGNFMDLQKNGTSKFTVDDTGRTDIKVIDADDAVALYINSEESTAGNFIFQIETDAQPTGDATTDNVKFGIRADGTIRLSLYASAASEAVCWDGADVESAAGSVEEDATLYDCNTGPNADYAEMYPVNSNVEVGDVVISGPQMVNTYDVGEDGNVDWTKVKGQVGRLQKSYTSYQTSLIGVVGENYSDFASTGYNIKEQDNPKSIALVGRVLVKVTAENGVIQPGDYLTSSATELGKAMKATRPGMVIGQALSGVDANGKVMVFVQTFYYDPTVLVDEGGNVTLQRNTATTTLSASTEDKAAYVIDQQGSGDILQLQQEGMDKLLVHNDGSVEINTSGNSDTGKLFVVNHGDDELLSIDIRGDLAIKGTIVMKDDSFTGSVVTQEDGTAEITFSNDLGTGKPSIQLTPEADHPVFAQVLEWRKDSHDNYTGFVMKTFGLDGQSTQSIVHYIVVGKQEDYETFGLDTLEVVNAPQGNQGSGGGDGGGDGGTVAGSEDPPIVDNTPPNGDPEPTPTPEETPPISDSGGETPLN